MERSCRYLRLLRRGTKLWRVEGLRDLRETYAKDIYKRHPQKASTKDQGSDEGALRIPDLRHPGKEYCKSASPIAFCRALAQALECMPYANRRELGGDGRCPSNLL